jgi:hypothetical protein
MYIIQNSLSASQEIPGLLRNFKDSLPYSQATATSPYPEPPNLKNYGLSCPLHWHIVLQL